MPFFGLSWKFVIQVEKQNKKNYLICTLPCSPHQSTEAARVFACSSPRSSSRSIIDAHPLPNTTHLQRWTTAKLWSTHTQMCRTFSCCLGRTLNSRGDTVFSLAAFAVLLCAAKFLHLRKNHSDSFTLRPREAKHFRDFSVGYFSLTWIHLELEINQQILPLMVPAHQSGAICNRHKL